eukprot:c8439_g1_i1.p1 GENE.c8439_g1_i1~~c8439_g1_i1.p1  ORF type:complete len:544 (+),score=152.35 c8439_g1_i1:39-1670(+)
MVLWLLCCALCTAQQTTNEIDDSVSGLQQFVGARGLTSTGTRSDLLELVSRITQVELFLDMKSPLTKQSMQTYLTSRDIVVTGDKDILFDRTFSQVIIEKNIRDTLQIPSTDFNVTRVTFELVNLGFTTEFLEGLKFWELSNILAQALSDVQVIRREMQITNVTREGLESMLRNRQLDHRGNFATLLTRLANSLRSLSPQLSRQCSMILGDSLCVASGAKIFPPAAHPEALVGHWTFDDMLSMDHSGNGNHPAESFRAGNGRNGRGASASLNATGMFSIPHSPLMKSRDLTVSLWLYLQSDSNKQWRTLLHKGSKDVERTPTLMLEPDIRGLEFLVSTTDKSQPAGERVWSSSVVPLRQWTHIAAVIDGRAMRLYVNGILDSENITIGDIVTNEGPIYLGNDPWRKDGSTGCLVDDLRYYSRALSNEEISVEAGLTESGGVAAGSVILACSDCSLDMCIASCKRWKTPGIGASTRYQMCSQRDMVSGAYLAIRSRGWANSQSRIWMSHADSVDMGGSVAGNGVGVCACCRDSDVDSRKDLTPL